MLGGSVGPGVGLLPLTLFPHRSLPEVPETIELEVRTSTASGLLVWQGEVSVGRLARGSQTPQPLCGRGSGGEKGGGHRRWGRRDAVFPWQEAGQSGRGKDFISLGLQDGHLVFRWVLAPPVPSLTPLILQQLSLGSPPQPHPPLPTPSPTPRSHPLGPMCLQLPAGQRGGPPGL